MHPSSLPAALRRLVSRIGFGDTGIFTPSPPPALFGVITDELLVVTWEAIAAAAAEQVEKPSGKASKRLFAWVIADARGVQKRIDRADAETYGKRLERQAVKVRDDLAAELAKVATARTNACASLDGEALATELAALDAREQKARMHPKLEVYIGFHELHGLLPEQEPEPEPEPQSAEQSEVAKPVPVSYVRYPWMAKERPPEPDGPPWLPSHDLPPVPPDLAKELGPTCVQELFHQVSATLNVNGSSGDCLLTDSDHWWSIGMPMLVRRLMWEKTARLADQDGHVAWLERRVEALEAYTNKQDELFKSYRASSALLEASLREVDEELAEAKGREGGLREAIRLMRGA